MIEEKGKNGKFWYKSHKVDANSWGKEGMLKHVDFHCSYA
jgi:hypothetical protein